MSIHDLEPPQYTLDISLRTYYAAKPKQVVLKLVTKTLIPLSSKINTWIIKRISRLVAQHDCYGTFERITTFYSQSQWNSIVGSISLQNRDKLITSELWLDLRVCGFQRHNAHTFYRLLPSKACNIQCRLLVKKYAKKYCHIFRNNLQRICKIIAQAFLLSILQHFFAILTRSKEFTYYF